MATLTGQERDIAQERLDPVVVRGKYVAMSSRWRRVAVFVAFMGIAGCRESASDGPCEFSPQKRYPARVIDHSTGGENNVTEPSGAEGAPDCAVGATNELSLGGGYVVFDLGCQFRVGSGPEFRIWESGGNCGGIDESYEVSVASDSSQYVSVGGGFGTTDFDVNGTGLKTFRYVRVEDPNPSVGGETPGPDMDALEILPVGP